MCRDGWEGRTRPASGAIEAAGRTTCLRARGGSLFSSLLFSSLHSSFFTQNTLHTVQDFTLDKSSLPADKGVFGPMQPKKQETRRITHYRNVNSVKLCTFRTIGLTRHCCTNSLLTSIINNKYIVISP